MEYEFEREIRELVNGPSYSFSEWPNLNVPHVAAGLYTIWHDQEFIYVGMSGRGLAEAEIAQKRLAGEKKKALYSRLESHASGRRSGDQFCLYICDHFIVPELSSSDLIQVRNGSISLDDRTKRFIRSKLQYRFVEVTSGLTALKVEAHLKRFGVNGSKPRLNPV
jgi:hypothetical protein